MSDMTVDLLLINSFLHPDLIVYPSGSGLVEGRLAPAYKQDVRAGGGAYTGKVAAQFGRNVSYLDWVGDDVFGNVTIEQLSAMGHDTSGIHRYSGQHMFCVSVADSHSQGATMVATYPPDWQRTFTEISDGIHSAASAADAYVYSWFWSFAHPDLHDAPTADLMGDIHRHHGRTVLDPNWKPDGPPPPHELAELRKSLPFVDMLLPNTRDASLLVGEHDPAEQVRRLLGLGPAAVVLTAGGTRAYWGEAHDGRVYSIPTPRVDVIDTTGAGDAFGGAIVSTARDLPSSVAIACSAASLTTAAQLGDGPLPNDSLRAQSTQLLAEMEEHR
ncbi:carbohydrate kinase family protein [Microbacterium sp. JAI119]|uniref:carbohydrate kinase family protein n=1 Tax=Microbacterium sp. JAI119 TaxID=2723062 RepID=UPI0015CB2FC2|nr:carbohydrate kinase family protein [Microbacterium sp. JAI119]NYF28086.1 sugar/nucleoside kinase (ribokinase family) [Microbacterium sp. JAI119]